MPLTRATAPEVAESSLEERISLRLFALICLLEFCSAFAALAANQAQPGAGNHLAEAIAARPPLIQSAVSRLIKNAQEIRNRQLRNATLDVLSNPRACIAHRAHLSEADKEGILRQLSAEKLVDPKDASQIEGGMKAGVFPPVADDGTPCPRPLLSFQAAPGSEFGGHHSYPGGLAVHEAFNQQNALSLAATYRSLYLLKEKASEIDQDVILAAPVLHDWAKTLVFQWNSDGTEFKELKIAGTGSHHILSLAESMARGLSPLPIITQASAHSAPTLGNEYKVVNWLRAAAIVARLDPLARGLLIRDEQGRLRLPRVKYSANGIDLNAGQANITIEYQIHNLSDADFVNSIPAIVRSESILRTLAPQFGYGNADTATFNNKYRNVALAWLSAAGIEMTFASNGLPGVGTRLKSLRAKGFI